MISRMPPAEAFASAGHKRALYDMKDYTCTIVTVDLIAYTSSRVATYTETIAGETTTWYYTYDGTRLIREELRSVSTNATTAYIYYYYDASGTPYGFSYRTADQSYTENFYYRRNL